MVDTGSYGWWLWVKTTSLSYTNVYWNGNPSIYLELLMLKENPKKLYPCHVLHSTVHFGVP